MTEMKSSSDDNPRPSGSDQVKHVVVAGAGVIGIATAYYLAENFGVSSTLVDPTGQLCPAASGKAGGFLALDWNDYSPTKHLARRSFALHQELANRLGADKLQYRRLTCAGVSVKGGNQDGPNGRKLEGVEWADDAMGVRSLGDESTIAQVHPKRLCESLWEVASKSIAEGGVGSSLVKGRVLSVEYDDGKLVGAKLEDGSVIEGDAVLFACGPWATNVMTGVKYHSVIIPTPQVLSQSVFFDGCGDPEVYPRPDSTAYCTGFPDLAQVVTEQPGEEEVRPEAVARILQAVREASGGTKERGALSAEPAIQQACYLPTTADGLPIMGSLPKKSGGGGQCFVAAGHGCWGILLGPATGEAMAKCIVTGEVTEHVDLRPFNPSRFRGIHLREEKEG